MRLFLQDRIDESIELLRMMEPLEGYYLAFSGGKDSVVLHEIARMSGVKFDAHYNITSADPPEIVQFIRENYHFVRMDRPTETMWSLIPKRLMPPTRLARYCCEQLKETGGHNRLVLVGVKKTDSVKRSKLSGFVYHCSGKKTVIRPIYHWTDDDVWEFIRMNNLPYCKLYDQGFKRLGCIGCPMVDGRKRKEQFQRWPKFGDIYLRSFARMLEERNRRGLETTWKTAEDVMNWWLSG